MKAFDLSPIVWNFYHDILEDDDRPDSEAYALLIIPTAISTIAFFRHIDAEFLSMMATALAILFGFTFSSLLSTARYSAKDDRVEELVVKQTRLGTSYALLVNLLSLISIIFVSIIVVDYAQLSYAIATVISAGVYWLLFHYLTTMVYLMRYLYLLAIGGAFATENESTPNEEDTEQEPPETTI